MRGASALDRLLAEFPEASLHAVVVWEPVIATDIGPPVSATLRRAKDPRVVQFWDPGRLVSAEILRSVNAAPRRYGLEEPFPPDLVVWDVVVLFDGAARWEGTLPVPFYFDSPVVNVIDEAREALAFRLGVGSGRGSSGTDLADP